MLSDLENLARRLEQQITSFEKLHADELARFQEQLATYQRLQNEELEMLHTQLNQLKAEVVHLRAASSVGMPESLPEAVPAPVPSVSVPTPVDPIEAYATLSITRRDLLTGNILPKRG